MAFALTCLVLIAGAPIALAQGFDATGIRQPTGLDTGWLIHPGDDPAYARPDFDDSRWMPFDAHTDVKTIFKTSHPDMIWYRLHVKVSPAWLRLLAMPRLHRLPEWVSVTLPLV